MQATDRRAGCGKTARPVRREGRGSIPRSYPYLWLRLRRAALYHRLPVGKGPNLMATFGGLETRETADWKSALPGQEQKLHANLP